MRPLHARYTPLYARYMPVTRPLHAVTRPLQARYTPAPPLVSQGVAMDVEAPLKYAIPLIEGPKGQTILMSACAWYDNGELIKLLHRKVLFI